MPEPGLPITIAHHALPPSMLPPPLLTGRLPLQGLTLLAVEDSRFCCEALRQLCQRSGARLRRAESLSAALAHLRLYRPDLVIVDLGLPDGRGEDLIRALSGDGMETGPVVLGCSAAAGGRALALSAGAVGFIDKPLPGLRDFQAAIQAALKGRQIAAAPGGPDRTDPQALRDDLLRICRALRRGQDQTSRDWLSGFLTGLARQSGDPVLAELAAALRRGLPVAPALEELIGKQIRGSTSLLPGTGC